MTSSVHPLTQLSLFLHVENRAKWAVNYIRRASSWNMENNGELVNVPVTYLRTSLHIKRRFNFTLMCLYKTTSIDFVINTPNNDCDTENDWTNGTDKYCQ